MCGVFVTAGVPGEGVVPESPSEQAVRAREARMQAARAAVQRRGSRRVSRF